MADTATIHTISDTTTIVSSASEADLFTYTLPTALLDVDGRGVRFIAGGDFLNNTAGADTLVIRLKLGTTTMLATPAISLTNSANRRKWRVEAYIMSTGTDEQDASGEFRISDDSTDTWASEGTSGHQAVGYGTATENAGNALDLDLTGQLGTSDASLDVQLHFANVEILR